MTDRKAELVQGLAGDLNTWQWEERRPSRGCTGHNAGTARQAGCTPSSAPSRSPAAGPPGRATGTYVKLRSTLGAPLLKYRALWSPQVSGCSSKGKERLATLHCIVDLVYSYGGFTHSYSCFVRLGYFVKLGSSIQVLTVPKCGRALISAGPWVIKMQTINQFPPQPWTVSVLVPQIPSPYQLIRYSIQRLLNR